MSLHRKLAAFAVTGGILAGGVAMAAPANAISGVACPTHGVTVHTRVNNVDRDWCLAGTVGRLTTNLGGVTSERTDWNWAQFSNQYNFIQLAPGVGAYNLGGEVNYWVGITNPNWVY